MGAAFPNAQEARNDPKRDTARAMSQENVEIVRVGVEHFRRTGDLLWDRLDPEFVWDMSTTGGWLGKQTYRGRDGFAEFMRDWLEAWDEWELEVEEWIDAGKDVVQVTRQRGKTRGGGPSVEMLCAMVWTLRKGEPVRMRMYSSKDEALEAVGLQE